jgi:HlyD family secretion protein
MTITFFHKSTLLVKTYILAHKTISAILAVVLVLVGYFTYNKIQSANFPVRYITASVERGTLITSVTGSGQVSALNQVELKSKVTGDVVYVGVNDGQIVKAWTLIAQLDARDAQKAVRDAEANLESAKLSLEKITKPADTLSLIQSENTLARANENKINAESTLVQSYEDALNTTSNVFLTLPNIMSGLQSILYSAQNGLGGTSQQNIDYYTDAVRRYSALADSFRIDVNEKYKIARAGYETNLVQYKLITRSSSKEDIEKLLEDTYKSTRNIAEAIKSTNNLIQLYKDELTKQNLSPATLTETHLSNLNTYTGNTNTFLTNLLNVKTSIVDARDVQINSERTIVENTESLAKLKAGTDVLDIRSQELSVIQKENALLDAREKFADYFIRAPFEGTVTKLVIKKGDSVSSGSIAGSLITSQKIVEISLNEVDAAKIEVGQKSTLTFDAIEDLEISGRVTTIDAIGTVSQGVVTYAVQITLDTQDIRVKSGMSVNATIITSAKQNILIVPNSALKSEGSSQYVETFDTPLTQEPGIQGSISPTLPKRQLVEKGLSNDMMTEIVTGLTEGDQVVVRTITSSSNTATQAPSIFGAATGNRGAGTGAVRALR